MRTFLGVSLLVGVLPIFGGCESEVIREGGRHGTDSVCSPFDDVVGTTPVTFRIRNDTGRDLFLPGLCQAPAFTIEGPDPSLITQPAAAGHCVQTCEELRSDILANCSDDSCLPWAFLVPSGTTRDIVWPGTALGERSMPESCWRAHTRGGVCHQLLPMPAGTCFFDIPAYAECEGACACDADGLCNGLPSGVPAELQRTRFAYPDDDGIVDVVFDSCAFGCAGG